MGLDDIGLPIGFQYSHFCGRLSCLFALQLAFMERIRGYCVWISSLV